jgi:hypothetical protein
MAAELNYQQEAAAALAQFDGDNSLRSLRLYGNNGKKLVRRRGQKALQEMSWPKCVCKNNKCRTRRSA